jgi:hypothetical protein
VASKERLIGRKSEFMKSRNPVTPVPIVVPDLGLGETPLVLSLWLVPQGSNVLEGDRVVELATNPATVDLLAPVAGECVRQFNNAIKHKNITSLWNKPQGKNKRGFTEPKIWDNNWNRRDWIT